MQEVRRVYEHEDKDLYAAVSRRRAALAASGPDSWPFPGKHEMHQEIAEETPIFHSLTVGGWRSRQRAGAGRAGRAVRSVHRPTVSRTADDLAAFHSDPLHAPVPAQATTRRRRDAERAADRRAIAELLGGAGRHRLSTPA
ncbi:hypothetical protein EV383_6153 [Pseudonocardia sediminis]|uniref:Uncharacterized protein n=1 Tax=Pseudonocardia sediminis TaxID=1397368 RepID=A0A4Q7V6R5_PSEST|nr:hypothetical protein [Pseudonocardia sediminis]RZT89194.1 hypothetical protein EV383_6153 [Pseudonocardia sediminis]